MLLFFGRLPWQLGLIIGIAAVGVAGYELANHQGGRGIYILGTAGLIVTVSSLIRSGRS
jgi:hypothetical protein